jgi:predicted ABC-class ATPase
LERTNTTYKEIYGGPIFDYQTGQTIFDPTYWADEVAYAMERTHKLTLDKPCVIIRIPLERLKVGEPMDELVLADFVLREWNGIIVELSDSLVNRSRPDHENGAFYSYEPSNAILRRNASYVETYMGKPYICILIVMQWPVGNPNKAMNMTCKMLPKAVEKFIHDFDNTKLEEAHTLFLLQQDIRQWLHNSPYCSFIANGSLLPRAKGSYGHLESALPFRSPQEDEIAIHQIKGMGIKKGVTVFTGGGYSGKSTLLDAVKSGVYNHIMGDGRELVITDATAVEIAAEEGRPVSNRNIAPFIKWIPGGTTEHFSTDHASGSTSQAANIIEAINVGAKLLLIDEDKSATNFMIRDELMKQLIKHEPIIPFTERVRELYEELDVSTILVIGGSGEYLAVADTIILMDDFVAENITKQAQALGKQEIQSERIPLANWTCARVVHKEHFTSYPQGSGTEKLWVSDMGYMVIGDEKIDVRALGRGTSIAQLSAIAFILRQIMLKNNEDLVDIYEAINRACARIEAKGLEVVFSSFFPDFSLWLEMPRPSEIMAVINRMRYLTYKD